MKAWIAAEFHKFIHCSQHYMTDFDYDLLVIGAGSAGLTAAQAAAQYGVRVAIADPGPLGGTCVNRGCVPKKLMVYASNFAREQCLAANYGWVNPSGEFDWSALRMAIEQKLAHLQQTYRSRLGQGGVSILNCAARFLAPHQIELGSRKVTVDKVIIATGAKPLKPDLPGIDCGLTSRDIFHLDGLPKQLTIVGGGYIGSEFSTIFSTLGCQVNLVERSPLILQGFDRSIRETLQQSLMDQGVRVLGGTSLEAIHKTETETKLKLSGNCNDTLIADTLLLALGRVPNVSGLNLEAAGIKVENGAIAVDDYSRTSCPHVFAIGDCTNRMPLTPVAKAEGKAAVRTLFGDQPKAVAYRWVPSAVFCSPEAATVGWSEDQAQNEGIDYEVYCDRFTPLHYALSPQAVETLIKLVVDSQTQTILGVHMVGDGVAEILQGLVPALKQGLTVDALTDTIGIHPTSGEELFSISR
jgi:glutathione reductase (NADPH)